MKKLLFAVCMLFGGLMLGTFSDTTFNSGHVDASECENVPNVRTGKKLGENERELYFMYENDNGYFFLDTLAEYENVIFVTSDAMKFNLNELHHGKKFIGKFADREYWELESVRTID